MFHTYSLAEKEEDISKSRRYEMKAEKTLRNKRDKSDAIPTSLFLAYTRGTWNTLPSPLSL